MRLGSASAAERAPAVGWRDWNFTLGGSPRISRAGVPGKKILQLRGRRFRLPGVRQQRSLRISGSRPWLGRSPATRVAGGRPSFLGPPFRTAHWGTRTEPPSGRRRLPDERDRSNRRKAHAGKLIREGLRTAPTVVCFHILTHLAGPTWHAGVTLGQVAQLVEQRTENPCVGGSIPPLSTWLKEQAATEVAAFFMRA